MTSLRELVRAYVRTKEYDRELDRRIKLLKAEKERLANKRKKLGGAIADEIVGGFDGSRTRTIPIHGTNSTALVTCYRSSSSRPTLKALTVYPNAEASN